MSLFSNYLDVGYYIHINIITLIKQRIAGDHIYYKENISLY